LDKNNSYGGGRKMDEICEVFKDCQKTLHGKCHGVVWCPIYNGGWNESHGSRRSKENITKEEMLNMLEEATQ